MWEVNYGDLNEFLEIVTETFFFVKNSMLHIKLHKGVYGRLLKRITC